MLESMAHDGNRRDDPIREVFARLVGIVAADGGISQRILRLRLRTLESDGLVARRTVDSRPPGVIYSLTAAGHGLVAQIHSLMNWSRQHSDEIRRARLAASQLENPK